MESERNGTKMETHPLFSLKILRVVDETLPEELRRVVPMEEVDEGAPSRGHGGVRTVYTS